MTNPEIPLRYSTVAMLLHWSIAVIIVVNFGLALFFSHFSSGDRALDQIAYQWHMSTGMCVLALSVLRVAWRLLHKYPPLPPDMNLLMRVLAKTSHASLYLFILVAPMTGWIVTSLRRQTASMLGLFDWPIVPYINTATTHDQRMLIYNAALPTHFVIAYAGIALVGLHIAAALYHHSYRRDDILQRMLPRTLTSSAPAAQAPGVLTARRER